ncbi:sigma-54-dependent Fis family transcriptional regulator [Candidatus Poribacteria bacterium]|nr:sigma-54-dependent Fis family transcriptional regulator [Candidatus Poribacteria bacterium]
MKHARILIADDEQATCKYIDTQLKMETSIDASVDFAYNRDAAIAQLDENPPYDLILVDLWMPDAQGILDREAGLKVLKQSKEQQPIPQAVVITANSSSETALEASGLGIHDYVSKPINYTHLIEVVKEVLSQRDHEPAVPDDNVGSVDDYEIIGKSPAMIEVMTTVGRVARSETDVLLYGESGTGKDFVARAIHKHSPRCKGPFEVVNCSAIPAELIEAELFGIGRRVATSVDQRPGKFQQAHGGTIFLDEIGDLSLEMQPKLLRVLDYKEIQGVGVKVQRVDVRIIAATNRDLGAAVEAGKFRSDLYYRLKPIIALPPLREREGDIELLAWHFLHKYSHFLEQKRTFGFDDVVLAAFEQYHWPGNVRELEKAIEYAILTCTGAQISVRDLAPEIFDKSAQPVLEFLNQERGEGNENVDLLEAGFRRLLDAATIKEASQGFERIFLEHKLKQNHWNIQATAEQIGIRRQSLHRKINELGLQRDLSKT